MTKTAIENSKATAKSSSISMTESVLGSELAPYAVATFFFAALMFWSFLDQSVAAHDPAWHSWSSSMVRQFLAHPKSWTVDGLLTMLSMQPAYPAGVWFFNGALKLILGVSHWSDQIILGIHLLILNLGTYLSAQLLFRDRLKSVIAQILINCCPIIMAIAHEPLLDLPFSAAFSVFFAAFLFWQQNQSWKRTAILAFIFGACCITKQSAIMYCSPCLVLAAGICAWKRQFQSVFQIACVFAAAGIFLLSWVIPNWKGLHEYSQYHTAFAKQMGNPLILFAENVACSTGRLVEGASLLVFLSFLALTFKIEKSDWKSAFPLILTSFGGGLLTLATAYYIINPQSRYFTPQLICISILLGSALAKLLRSKMQGLALILIGACITQALALSFRARPTYLDSSMQGKRYKTLADARVMADYALREHLWYVPEKDLWKQEWLLNFIEKAQPGQFTKLLILSNSKPYNKGSLMMLAANRHSKISCDSWHGSGADWTDTFHINEYELNKITWFAEKSGDDTRSNFFDQESKNDYMKILDMLRTSGKYREAGRTKLPDGTELVLHQKI